MAFLASTERNAKIVELAEGGLGPSEIARQMGITKNVAIGIIQRWAPHLVVPRASRDDLLVAERPPFSQSMTREEKRERREAYEAELAEVAEINADVRAFARMDDGLPIRTLWDRCDALHARMDAVLAETASERNHLPRTGRVLNAARLNLW